MPKSSASASTEGATEGPTANLRVLGKGRSSKLLGVLIVSSGVVLLFALDCFCQIVDTAPPTSILRPPLLRQVQSGKDFPAVVKFVLCAISDQWTGMVYLFSCEEARTPIQKPASM